MENIISRPTTHIFEKGTAPTMHMNEQPKFYGQQNHFGIHMPLPTF